MKEHNLQEVLLEIFDIVLEPQIEFQQIKEVWLILLIHKLILLLFEMKILFH